MTADPYLFAVSDPAFQTTGTICGPNEFFTVFVVGYFVVHLRTRQAAGFDARANRHRLNRGYRHYGLGQASVEFQIPGGMRAEARHYSTCDYFEYTAEGISCFPFTIDKLDHLLLDLLISTTQGRFF